MEVLHDYRRETPEERFKQNLFTLFQINLENWINTEFALAFHAKLPIQTQDEMEFWRLQIYIENYKKYVEEKNKESEGKNSRDVFSMDNAMKDAKDLQKQYTPKMPDMGNFSKDFKLPKF